MSAGYSWSDYRSGGTYRLPGPDHLGWWAAAAMLVSILLHVGVFLMLDRMNVALRFEEARQLSTQPVTITQVEVSPSAELPPVPPDPVEQPPTNAAALLDEIDLLRALPDDKEIDFKPDVLEPEYALQMSKPAETGDPAGVAMEVASSLEVDADLPEMGREPSNLPPAAVGQVVIDPGSAEIDDDALGKLTDDLIKRGANGLVDKGALDGVTSLDDLLDLPPNLLLAKKTLLPSDLLFEFNKSDLRESAKVGLMKLALLMDRNPDLYCWIEGHTDLIGGDEFNLNLSIRRAEAVKQYLVDSLRMDAARISTRGFGRFSPIVIDGDQQAQAINRRVEVRMRKTPPPADQIRIVPERATPVETTGPAPQPVPPAPEPPRAILIQPARPVEEPPPAAVPVEAPPPVARPIELPPVAIPRAQPVEAEAPQAEPVR